MNAPKLGTLKLALGGTALSLGLLAASLGLTPGVGAQAPLPDLRVTNITESADPVDVNQEYGYLVTMQNVGNAAASGIRIDGTLLGSGTVAGQVFGTSGFNTCTTSATTWSCSGGSLAAGAQTVITVPVKAPDAVGTVQLGTRIDPQNTLAESNEGNNSASMTVRFS